MIRCLQDAREDLSYECRATLFDAEVRMAEDIDFKYPMKRACTAEIGRFCGGLAHGHARDIRCLQDHVDEPDMASECKEEITRDQIRSNHDYRCARRGRAPGPGAPPSSGASARARRVGPARRAPARETSHGRACAPCPAAARARSARRAAACSTASGAAGAQAELPPERGVRGGHRRAVHRGV